MAIHPTRRQFLAAAAAGALLDSPFAAFAQSFPEKGKQIRGISPYAVGSTGDTLARAYAQAMSESMGTTVIIDNRPGAEGVIGVQAVKAAPADGYTMLFTSLSTQVVNPHLFKKLSYDPLTDLIPLAGTMRTALCMTVSPTLPFKSAKEFIDAAKAAPGKYSYASISATTRVAGETLAKTTGAKLLNVPYKQFGDLMADLLTGRVDIFMIDPPSVLPFTKQGVRVFATAASKRLPAFPDVPTFQELGYAGLEIPGWHAAYAPAKTPPEVVAVLRDSVQKAGQSKYVKDYYSRFGMEPLDLVGDQLAAFQKAEYDKWGKAVHDAGLTGIL